MIEIDKLIKALIGKTSETGVIFIDSSTPPLLSGKVKKFIGIDVLSEISQKTVGTRKDAISKVRRLIDQQISFVVDHINVIAPAAIQKNVLGFPAGSGWVCYAAGAVVNQFSVLKRFAPHSAIATKAL